MEAILSQQRIVPAIAAFAVEGVEALEIGEIVERKADEPQTVVV